MLHIGLVLLLASSALAAPRTDNIIVDLDPNLPIARNTGGSNHLTDYLSSLFDGGDLTINTVTLQKIINDLASIKEGQSQVLATSQSIGSALALIATGEEIDANECVVTALINAYQNGNYRAELKQFMSLAAKNLQKLVTLKQNPQSLRFGSSPAGARCNSRAYSIEAAWNAILDNATPANNALLDEEFCTVKRLNKAFDNRSNHHGSVITAVSLPPVQEIFKKAFTSIVKFLNALFENGDVYGTLRVAQQALQR